MALDAPSGHVLRPYQSGSIENLRATVTVGHCRVVLQLPTGSGKTIVAAEIIIGARNLRKTVIFTVPNLSLIDQTLKAFEAMGITDIGVIQADHPRTNYFAPVQIASVQTLARRALPAADLVIVDEAHHYSKVFPNWMARDPNTILLGSQQRLGASASPRSGPIW